MQQSPMSARIVALLEQSKQTQEQKDSAAAAQSHDTHSVAALALLVQATIAAAAAAPASASVAPASASTAASAAVSSAVAASPSPLHSSLPTIAALLSVPFLSRLLSTGCGPSDPRLPAGALPPLRDAAKSDGASYPELALRALHALAANPQAVQVLAMPSSSSTAAASSEAAAANVVAMLLSWLQSPSFTASSPELRPTLLILALQVMERMALTAAAASADSDAAAAACTPTLALTQLQPLTHLLPALQGDVELACVRSLSWLLPGALSIASTAQRTVACKHLIPTFAALFERDTGLLKLESLRILVALHEVAATIPTLWLEEDGEAPPMLPLPQPLRSMRAALEQLLATKLDLPVRLQMLKLCRLLLQQHGPMFATVPASYSRGPGNAARRASNVAHTSFVQLLANIPVIEMRMTLMLSSSTRAADIALMQGAGGRMREQILMESMQLIRFLLNALLGDDDDVQEEQRAYQFWNLPVDVLMQVKKRLDECSESWLSYLHDLASHPAHPRSPHVLWEVAQCVALWMAEEEGAAGHLEVHQTLPFLVNIKNPHVVDPQAASAASSSSVAPVSSFVPAGPSSILSLLLPSLLFLSTNWDAALILRDQDVPRRLVIEVLLEVWSRGVEKQAALLMAAESSAAASSASASSVDDDEELPSSERHEIRASLAHQLIHALLELSNAAQVVFNLVHEHAAALKKLQPLWPQLREALSAAIKIAQSPALESQDSEFSLKEAVDGMKAMLELCTKKFGNGSK